MGIVLAIAILVVYAVALIAVLRVPFRALGVLVAGMAVHNFMLMILLRLGTPGFAVRVVQSWKEGILILLGALVAQRAWRAWQAPLADTPQAEEGKTLQRAREILHRLTPMDWVAVVFAALLVIYLLMPARILHNEPGYARRVIEFRQLFLLPLLYLYGRVFWPARREDLTWVFRLILGAAAVVGLFGIIELFFIPTTTWLNLGITQLSDWLHYAYNGPQHFPEYFFQTTSEGLLLRRMVSTYVSPLGIAYTGLLIVPLAARLLDARRTGLPTWYKGMSIALLVVAVMFSVTRLAIALAVIEFALLLVLLRRRWLLAAVPAVIVLALVVVFQYINFGPITYYDLSPVPVRPKHMALGGSTADPSIRGHMATLRGDIQYAIIHPLGTGLGSSIHQFGSSGGRGESAIFDVFDDAGLVTGALYLALYAMAIYHGYRAWRSTADDPLLSALPLVACVGGLILAPIALTSEVNGDFSVTFFFWWAAGFALTARMAPSLNVSNARLALKRRSRGPTGPPRELS
jgi:hypothetical protein